jgi:hypothetical protein
MTNKEFDCVEMKHRAAKNVQGELAGKSIKDKIAFWKKRQHSMLARQTSILNAIKKAS